MGHARAAADVRLAASQRRSWAPSTSSLPPPRAWRSMARGVAPRHRRAAEPRGVNRRHRLRRPQLEGRPGESLCLMWRLEPDATRGRATVSTAGGSSTRSAAIVGSSGACAASNTARPPSWRTTSSRTSSRSAQVSVAALLTEETLDPGDARPHDRGASCRSPLAQDAWARAVADVVEEARCLTWRGGDKNGRFEPVESGLALFTATFKARYMYAGHPGRGSWELSKKSCSQVVKFNLARAPALRCHWLASCLSYLVG